MTKFVGKRSGLFILIVIIVVAWIYFAGGKVGFPASFPVPTSTCIGYKEVSFSRIDCYGVLFPVWIL